MAGMGTSWLNTDLQYFFPCLVEGGFGRDHFTCATASDAIFLVIPACVFRKRMAS